MLNGHYMTGQEIFKGEIACDCGYRPKKGEKCWGVSASGNPLFACPNCGNVFEAVRVADPN